MFAWISSIVFYVLLEVIIEELFLEINKLVKITHTIETTQKFNILQYLGQLKIGVGLIKYVPLVDNFEPMSFLISQQRFITISSEKQQEAWVLPHSFSTWSEPVSQCPKWLSITWVEVWWLLCGSSNKYRLATPTINPIKTGLAAVTIFYDIILVFQYFLYRNRPNIEMEGSSIGVFSTADDKEERLIKTDL